MPLIWILISLKRSNKYSLFIPESHLTSSDLQTSGPGALLFFSTVKTASSSWRANGESSMLLLPRQFPYMQYHEELQRITWREYRPLDALQDPWPFATYLWTAFASDQRRIYKAQIVRLRGGIHCWKLQNPTTCKEIAVVSRSATGIPRWGRRQASLLPLRPGGENFERMPSCQKRSSQTEKSHARAPQTLCEEASCGVATAWRKARGNQRERNRNAVHDTSHRVDVLANTMRGSSRSLNLSRQSWP